MTTRRRGKGACGTGPPGEGGGGATQRLRVSRCETFFVYLWLGHGSAFWKSLRPSRKFPEQQCGIQDKQCSVLSDAEFRTKKGNLIPGFNFHENAAVIDVK
jgi:hypothetical protein